jgi:hypothetical protein
LRDSKTELLTGRSFGPLFEMQNVTAQRTARMAILAAKIGAK